MASLSLSSGVASHPFSRPSFYHLRLQRRHHLRKVLVPGSNKNVFFHRIADEFYPLVKLKMAIIHAQKQIPQHHPHWAFCYTILPKVSKSFSLLIQQLPPDYQHAAIIMYLVLRTLDTVEDDTSIPTDIKVPILKAFHGHIYDSTWHFPCGTRQHDKVLMNEFHHVSNAFLELDKGCQEIIEASIKGVGTSMAKFICKEVETVDDYDEYCHSIAGLTALGLAKLFHAYGSEDLPPDSLAVSMGLFNQKAHFIKDFLDDINEIPKPRIFWPREIWSKYATKLEDLKDEENSDKAVQCLNEMVTDSLRHVEDCLTFFSTLKQHSLFRFCAVPQIVSMGNLALYYDNIQLFRHAVEMRRGGAAKIFDRTKTMEDVYGAFFDYSSIMKSKVNKNDPNATLTLSRLDAIQKACTDSGLLNNKRKLYIV